MFKKITREAFLKMVSQETGYSRHFVDNIIKPAFDIIIREVSLGNQVNIQDFGSFEQQYRAARTGRNPHTNKPVPIAPRLVPKFTPSQHFKNRAVVELQDKE